MLTLFVVNTKQSYMSRYIKAKRERRKHTSTGSHQSQRKREEETTGGITKQEEKKMKAKSIAYQ